MKKEKQWEDKNQWKEMMTIWLLMEIQMDIIRVFVKSLDFKEGKQ